MEEELNTALRKQLDLALRERDAARRTIDDDQLEKHKLKTRIKELENTLGHIQRFETQRHEAFVEFINATTSRFSY